MLDIKLVRDNPGFVKERLAHKHFDGVAMVDEIIAIDARRRQLQQELDALLSESKQAAREIGQLIQQGKKEESELKRQQVSGMKEKEKELSQELSVAEQQQMDIAIQLPNLPAAQVPGGKTPEENELVRQGGVKPQLPQNAVPHWELIRQYDIIDFETGAKITGSGFPLYKGKGSRLQRALYSYFLDFNTEAGYTEYTPPYMVNSASAFGTGQLPDKEGQMYTMEADELYMIPTAEVPVTNIYRDTILSEADLPIKMTAYSPCFRREAGSFGAQVRGLNRVHQFEKVEIIQITHPEKSYDALDEMVNHVERLVQSLELPYRIIRLCGGDMGFASAITYDFEVWSAAQERWLEVSSVSNFESFQSNRMKCRFRNSDGKTQLVHTLNGSSMALPRIVAAMLENNQSVEGIRLPKVLHGYFGAEILTVR